MSLNIIEENVALCFPQDKQVSRRGRLPLRVWLRGQPRETQEAGHS